MTMRLISPLGADFIIRELLEGSFLSGGLFLRLDALMWWCHMHMVPNLRLTRSMLCEHPGFFRVGDYKDKKV